MHFFNKDLFPLLNKHSIKDIEQDYFDFNTVMKETEIIKSVSYNNAYKKACQIFIEGISLCLDIILSNKKDKNINELNELNKKRENFVKDVLILFRFEKVINEYYQKYKKDQFIINDDKFDFFEPKKKLDIDIEPIEINYYTDNLDENSDIFPFKSPFSTSYKNDFIFDNKKFYIKNTSSNNEKNNYFKINYIEKEKNVKMPFSSMNSNDKNNNNNIIQDYVYTQIQSNYIKYKHKYTKKKKKIKEYKFSKKIKRENVDKKILRKFKKYLKHKMREKTDNEVKNYIKNNNNQFWPDYISMNLMPPFSYEKEDISFKSFNSKYLCWFFDHKYSQELYNIFISKSFDELLNLIMKDYEINEESEDYKLLKIYINTMPMIYGDDTGSTTFSSNIAESDVDVEENKVKEKKENDSMIIESDNESKNNNEINFDYMSRSINNINININVNRNDEGNNNDLSFINDNENNSEMNIESNLDMTDNCNINNINNMNINNSFEKEHPPNLIQFDQNIFNKI